MVRPSGTSACQQLFPRDPRPICLDPVPQNCCFFRSTVKIGPHFVAVPEVIGYDGVDVTQP
jgi:hypothetical protein